MRARDLVSNPVYVVYSIYDRVIIDQFKHGIVHQTWNLGNEQLDPRIEQIPGLRVTYLLMNSHKKIRQSSD